MKKLISIFVVLFIITTHIFAQHTYVLVAGISNYGDEETNLHQTTKDAKAIKEVFDKQPNTTVAILTSKYASGSNIEEKLNAMVKLAKPTDKIIFCFSGHGTTGGFVSYGPQLFSYKTLAQILSNAKAQNIICFIDACMSGSVQNDATSNYGFSEGNSHQGLCFIVGSRADEISWENNWVGHGFFTKALLKGLRGLSDKNRDKQVTLKELFDYVYNDVTARTKKTEHPQHPQLIGPSSSHNVVITSW